jgi:Amt family ammonium transporter
MSEVTLESVAATLDDLVAGTDVFYTLFCGAAIFLMQCGFAMLCAGSIRQKNVKNIMLKNILDACGGALGYWAVGFGVAYEGGSFIGTSGGRFFLNDYSGGASSIDFFFQFTFVATAAIIVAGTVAERCKMVAYLCYSLFLTGFVYPVVVHAIWNGAGFLTAFNENDPFMGIGMIDFAGSGVVHMTGGATALIAAVILGPRIGRFYDEDGNPLDKPAEFPPHSVALQVLGTFILWFGWYGFNPGSTLSISPAGYGDIAALCAVTTTLSAAAGAVSSMFTDCLLGFLSEGEVEYDLTMCMNGCLGGLVGITAGCSVVEPWAAIIIGIISGVVYVFSSKLLVMLKIDDAVDAIPVHFFNGMWGCIATGLFASPRHAAAAYVNAANNGHSGLFFSDGNLLVCEICGVLFIIAWVGAIMTPFFLVLNMIGWFRVDPIEEKVGLDISHHKGAAYDLKAADDVDIETFHNSKHGKA